MSRKIVILGAGLAGLSAAYHMNNGCFLYEQEDKVGGLARTDVIDGFTFDYDGHLLHFKTEYAKNLVQKLLPGLLVAHKRNSWIYSHEVYTRYPFQANTFGLPKDIVKKCVLGMLKKACRKKTGKAVNLNQWMLMNFGQGITKYFMYPYNLKFWTIPPQELIPDWTEGYVPRVNVRDVVEGAFTSRTKLLGYNSEFWYPKEGGIDQLARGLSRHIKNIKMGYKISAIDISKKKINFENGKSCEFTHLVSTIPLLDFKGLLAGSMPEDVKRAFSNLMFISIYNLNLGVDRENISDKHWIYYPEDKFCFFRVGFPMNFSKSSAPREKSSLYAEVSYSQSRSFDRNNIEGKIKEDLVLAGILNKNDAIIASHTNDIRYGYVVYDHNYCQSMEVINKFLLRNNIYTAGRFGSWRYMSMEDCLIDGKLISERFKE